MCHTKPLRFLRKHNQLSVFRPTTSAIILLFTGTIASPVCFLSAILVGSKYYKTSRFAYLILYYCKNNSFVRFGDGFNITFCVCNLTAATYRRRRRRSFQHSQFYDKVRKIVVPRVCRHYNIIIYAQ